MEDKFVLNLDAPDTDGEEEIADDLLLPAPDMVLNDYLDPHAAEHLGMRSLRTEQSAMTASALLLLPSYTFQTVG